MHGQLTLEMLTWPTRDGFASYQVAAGSGDDTIRIWDLRALKVIYSIPAHKSSISDLKFFRSTAEAAASYGQQQPNGLPNGGGGDIDMDTSMDVDDKPTTLNESGLFMVSSGFDHTVKIWSADDWQLIKSLKTDEGKVMSVDVSGDAKFIASGSYSRSFHLFAGENV
jgi:U4/U6 small nuclear ribonucleoprotein PRP4